MSFFKDKIYPPSLQIPKPIQLLAKFLFLVSKYFAIRFATYLFTTPIGFKRPKREIPMFESSQKRYIDVPAISKKVHVLSYGYSDKKVLLVHGWAGRDTQLFMIANKLLEKGFMVISLDAPAHGKSTGKQTNLIEYVDALKEVHKQLGPFDAAIGHSFGGMTILNTQSQLKIFNCIVTIGSGDKVSDILNNFSENLSLPKSFGKRLKQYFDKKWNVDIDDYASSKVAKNIDVPSLVVHDSIDGDVNVSCAINIRQNLSNGNLLVTKGLGHTKILRTKSVTNRIVEFIISNT